MYFIGTIIGTIISWII